ncbi:MAG: hypothetical protein JWQ23_1387 [Herminiimonas sp.]|nr:hypothetical protein [Herminiimonas sp.]
MNHSTHTRAGSARSTVSSLGYLQIGVTDLAAWQQFASKVLGCMVVPDTENNRLLLRLDDRSFRIVLQGGGHDDLDAIGWELANPEALQAMAAQLQAEGTELRQGTAEEAAARNVIDLYLFTDASGLRHEIYCGPGICHEAPFTPSRAHAGFEAGNQGVGHVFLSVTDAAAAQSLYRQSLGLRLTDMVNLKRGGREVMCSFLRCNERHHSVAFGQVGGPKRLQHLMLQVRDLDDVGRTLDIAQQAGIRLRRAIGKHSNDHMVSFYMETPSGFQIEYGWGALEVDDATWRVQTHQVTSKWGHQQM